MSFSPVFSEQVTLDGIGVAYRLDVSFDAFDTIAHRWGSVAGKLDGTNWYKQALNSIGDISRGFGTDRIAASSQIEIVLDNLDGQMDFLCGQRGSSQVMRLQCKLYIVVFTPSAQVTVLSGNSKCVGRFRVMEYPERTSNLLKLTLCDDVLGASLASLRPPTIRDIMSQSIMSWRPDFDYNIGDTVETESRNVYVCVQAGTSSAGTSTLSYSSDVITWGPCVFIRTSAALSYGWWLYDGHSSYTWQTYYDIAPLVLLPGATYTPGQRVLVSRTLIGLVNFDSNFTCATGGTTPTGEGGPTGTSNGISDGTVLWNFVKVAEPGTTYTAINPKYQHDEIPIPIAFGEDWVPAPLYFLRDAYDDGGAATLNPTQTGGGDWTPTTWTDEETAMTYIAEAPYCCSRVNDGLYDTFTYTPALAIRLEHISATGHSYITDVPAQANLTFNKNLSFQWPTSGGDYTDGLKNLAITYTKNVQSNGKLWVVRYVKLNWFYIGWWLYQNNGSAKWSPATSSVWLDNSGEPGENTRNGGNQFLNVGSFSGLTNQAYGSTWEGAWGGGGGGTGAAQWTLNRIWVKDRHLSSTTNGLYTDARKHPADVLSDLLTSYCDGAQSVNTTSSTRLKRAMPAASCSNVIYPFEVAPGQAPETDKASVVRRAVSNICQSFDIDVFMNWAGEIAFAQESVEYNDFLAAQGVTGFDLPTISATRIWDVSERVPAPGQRYSPYNSVTFTGIKQAQHNSYTLMGYNEKTVPGGPFAIKNADIDPSERLVQITLDASWMSQRTQEEVLKHRHLDVKYRPVVTFTTDISALNLDLGDYFFFNWSIDAETPVYENTIFQVDQMLFSPSGLSVTITAVWAHNTTVPTYLLDSEAINKGLFAADDYLSTNVYGPINQTSTAAYVVTTEGSNFIQFKKVSDNSVIDPRALHISGGSNGGVFAGDVLVIQDATENAWSLFRNRSVTIISLTATGVYFDKDCSYYGTQFGGGGNVATWYLIHGAASTAYDGLSDGLAIISSASTGTFLSVTGYVATVYSNHTTTVNPGVLTISDTGDAAPLAIGQVVRIKGTTNADDLYLSSRQILADRSVTITAIDTGAHTFTFVDNGDTPLREIPGEDPVAYDQQYWAFDWVREGTSGGYLSYPADDWWTIDGLVSYPHGWDMYGAISRYGTYSDGVQGAILMGG